MFRASWWPAAFGLILCVFPGEALADTTPPTVTVTAPNGGEVLTPESPTFVTWSAIDSNGVAFVDIFASYDGGASYQPIALGISGVNRWVWHPPHRPTSVALLRVEATDNADNVGSDVSNGMFTIGMLPGGLLATTLRDFDQPGTQPFEHDLQFRSAENECSFCHGEYDPAVEPYATWRGSMMANASRDPLFLACLTIANQDAPSSGDLCIRCHVPRAWVNGRSSPTDGSLIEPEDREGVACDMCHRMVDPIYDAQENPTADQAILAGLSMPGTDFGNGMFVIDPDGIRRGPFEDVNPAHAIHVSPFHQEAAFCGTCHDVSNPALESDGMGNYVPNAVDAPATDFGPHSLMPLERTYSEWLHSAYNSPGGVYAPQFGGNKDYVSTCQDCHMRDVTGPGCSFTQDRTDLPLHDLTGGSTWMLGLLAALFPGEIDPVVQQAAVQRARYMLQNAATLEAGFDGAQLHVTVTNETGHKLPTGYPEGRRMWLNVKFRDAGDVLLGESGAYDPASGILTHDGEIRVYEAELGLDQALATTLGMSPGPSFHFVLNNKVFKDNRIPPRGFTNADFATFGGAPVGAAYADGQYWDDTTYSAPTCAASAEVTLYYQSTSKEYIEFLRDENVTDANGQNMYDLWSKEGKAPPEAMATVTVVMPDCNEDGLPDWCEAIAAGDFNADGLVNLVDHAALADCLAGPEIEPAFPLSDCARSCLRAFDFDADQDVDLEDYGAFQAVYGSEVD